MKSTWLLALLTSLLLVPRAHAQCKKDTDCKGDRICVDGACASPSAAPAPAAAPARAGEQPTAAPRRGVGSARKLLIEVDANLQRGIEAVGGSMRVYSTHIAFRPHAINVQRKDAVIKMRDVAKVEKYGLIPNGLRVIERDGSRWEFRVSDRDKVLALIRDAAGL